MKLEKAIEILETESRCLSFKGATERLVAVKLGIEAGKKINNIRSCHPLFKDLILPGETRE